MRYDRALAITRRHSRLIRMIRKGTSSAKSLAGKLAVSEQTIYRDVDFLKHRGYSIRSVRHTDGWAYHLLAEPATISTGEGSAG